jgi:hypothetical protein
MTKQLFRIQKFLLIALIAGPAAALAAGMQPGLWEITSSMEVSGMNMKMPSYTFQHCYTPSEVSDAKKIVPRDPQQNKCQVTDVKQSGDTVSWKMICTGEHAMTGNGAITFGSNSYSGTTQLSMASEGGMTMNMLQKYSGKRLGDCSKK